jgi:hypothetical protein
MRSSPRGTDQMAGSIDEAGNTRPDTGKRRRPERVKPLRFAQKLRLALAPEHAVGLDHGAPFVARTSNADARPAKRRDHQGAPWT